MAGSNSDDGKVSLFNLQSVLALLTLVGGILLVSPKITSNRPLKSPEQSPTPIGDQVLATRLWEDPFSPQSPASSRQNSLQALRDQIARHMQATGGVLLLPVMVSGGPYGEDVESRIRSRFAVVSALGQSGFAPLDAEHVGTLEIPWPSSRELERWRTSEQARLLITTNTSQAAKKPIRVDATITTNAAATTNITIALNVAIDDEDGGTAHAATNTIGASACPADDGVQLRVRFEWYRPRVFHPGNEGGTNNPYVLVLWLDDASFEDAPLLRLPLFLAPLVFPTNDLTQWWELPPTNTPVPVQLLGPRSSTTLRAMLPGQFGSTEPAAKTGSNLLGQASNVLRCITVNSATASAMDEVLVTNAEARRPRQAVQGHLVTKGFRQAHFFNATDAELAAQVFDELALRNVELTNRQDHLVLISEWDTFYGRMLSLTYAAELAVRQRQVTNRIEFVTKYRDNALLFPSNLHSFVYLRGLDGQTVGDAKDAEARKADGAARDRVASFEDVFRWRPQSNKAEGPTQLDYLSRLGDHLVELESQLDQSGNGRIKAVGIVGSDVYDTLVILQALRKRFPHALFFTTDLDARFCHPDEMEHCRNLIVVSGYGLALNPRLQQSVPPFRDSAQTAQFAATLALLARTNLSVSGEFPVRRYEIGNQTVVDLSVVPTDAAQLFGVPLHPPTAVESGRKPDFRTIAFIVLLLVTAFGLAACLIPSLRRVTFEASQHQAEVLFYRDEDLGDEEGEGAFALLSRLYELEGKGDLLARWLWKELGEENHRLFEECRVCAALAASPATNPSHGLITETGAAECGDARKNLKQGLAGILNNLLRQEAWFPEEWIGESSLFPQELLEDYHRWRLDHRVRCPFFPSRPRQRLNQGRRYLDAILKKLSATDQDPTKEIGESATDVLNKAVCARRAALELFHIRRHQVYGYWAGAIVVTLLGVLISWLVWRDTFRCAQGEPFSLSSGISAWPAEIIRMIALVLAVCFILRVGARLRATLCELTREYCLPLARSNSGGRPSDGPYRLFEGLRFEGPKAMPVPQVTVKADGLWEVFQLRAGFWNQARRICLPFVLYALFASACFLLGGGSLLRPVRGSTLNVCDLSILVSCVLAFLFLTFRTIDVAFLCQRFIQHLSEAPTDYSAATNRRLAYQRGGVTAEYLDEWIDLQLIADLTERVGRLVYYPFIVLFLLLLARNNWWDGWPWPTPLIIVLTCNLALAVASVVILRSAARKAKAAAEATLEAKVKRLQAECAPTPKQNEASQSEQLLDEIRHLRRGAFAPLWESPLLGAVLIPSGGTVLIQLLLWFMGR